jgi:hypothetical protein
VHIQYAPSAERINNCMPGSVPFVYLSFERCTAECSTYNYKRCLLVSLKIRIKCKWVLTKSAKFSWNEEKARFMALPKTGLITNQYCKHRYCPTTFSASLLPLRNVLWCARKSPFMALRKLRFVTSMPTNCDWQNMYCQNSRYRTLTNYSKWFIDYIGEPI